MAPRRCICLKVSPWSIPPLAAPGTLHERPRPRAAWGPDCSCWAHAKPLPRELEEFHNVVFRNLEETVQRRTSRCCSLHTPRSRGLTRGVFNLRKKDVSTPGAWR